MKKIIKLIFICVLSFTVLTSCSSRDNSEYENSKNNGDSNITEEKPNNSEDYNKVNGNSSNNNDQNTSDDEQLSPDLDTVLTMSADFEKLSALDSKKLGWGPGGPVDANNRSQGAISYQEKYGKYNADFILPEGNEISLTFDEGYENGYTAKILDILKEKKVSAVFFVTFPYARDNPELIKRMIDEGHVVGNHSTDHKSFPDLSLDQAKTDIENLHKYIKENYNYSMKLFRFPMGEFNEQCLGLLNDMGYKSVFWSFAYRDWLVDEQPDPEQSLQQLNNKSHGGAIYLLHAVSKTNTDILGEFIDEMRGKGYEFIDYEEKIKTNS
ncbi:MAG: polysaccharide deacetylase family protein [Oscillospiraceae bacterium]